MSTESEK